MVKRAFEVYTIFNHGTPHSFHTGKIVIDPYTNTERTLLAVHVDKVIEADDPLVFIVDNEGRILDIDGPLP